MINKVNIPREIREVKNAETIDEKDDKFYNNNSIFNLAVLNIIAHHYDNRSITSNEQSFDVPASSMKLIQTLRSNLVKWRKDNIEVIADES